MTTKRFTGANACASAAADHGIATEPVADTSRGSKAVRSDGAPLRPVDLDELRAVTAAMPPQAEEAAAFVRAMRDDERY